MKILIATMFTVLCVALFSSIQASQAQESPLDLGQTNLLLLACDYAKDLAAEEGITVKNCRRNAPEEVNGYKADVSIRISTNVGVYILEYSFMKSLWGVKNLVVVPD